MRRLGPLLAALALSLSPIAPAAGQGAEVSAIDDVFRPETIRIPVGGTVTWINEGRNPHTAAADDEAWDSGNLDPGDTFSRTFDEQGAIPYYCRYHGAAGGLGMAGTILVGDAPEPEDEAGPPQPPPGEGETLDVPADHPTIQAAVDAAEPGDLVLVSPGIYPESVRVTTPFLTIRGTDRNEVVVDGEFSRENGIHVLEADGVTVENMTARNHTLNGFYWTGVEGYRGSYLTAYNNGDYGIYAFDSVYGQFDHSYASGSPDAGFYIGQCRPCHAVISDVVAEGNALGYSGTNAGGDLYIVRSEWRKNMSGIVPNTLDSQLLAPQGEVVIAGNWIHDNNNRGAPAKRLQYPTFGSGVLLAGGTDNIVVRNRVEGHERYGIAAVPNLDANLWVTEGNEVRANLVRGSGEADLALGGPAAGGDCFAENDHGTSLPPAIEALAGCGLRLTGGAGDLGVTFSLLGRFAQALSGEFPRGDYRTATVPPPQQTMPGAETSPPAPAVDVPMEISLDEVGAPQGAGERIDHQEVTVLGIGVAAPTWWGLLISVYGYLLPLVLYAAWVSVAAWDLVRRDGPTTRARVGWLAVVLLVPFLGPILYLAFGRSPIPAALRWMLVAGGLGAYLIFAGVSFLLASS
ncbi:MAG TPA: PLDc N-terminal domain-containing protein [Actinomycetota bacterium]